MSRPLRLLLVAAARPNFMKVAPILRALHDPASPARGRLTCQLVHTGQHYDPNMSDIFFRELGIPAPDFNLGVGGGSHAEQTANVMLRFEALCRGQSPDGVVVVGDVNSTLACALVAAKLRIRVAHVEAGLRSFDRTMPEEINRLVTDAISDLLLTPSADADENLAREGVPTHRIRLVGNIMIDTLLHNLGQARRSPLGGTLGLLPGKFVYATLHRPANVDDRESLRRILAELELVGRDLPVVCPLHPRTRKMMTEFGLPNPDPRAVHVIPPVGYHDSLYLTEHARFVLTDSGGLQEEATYFRTPCLTLRPNTERPITVTLGSNQLVSLETLPAAVSAVLSREPRFGQIPPLWDGQAAGRIVSALLAAA